MNCLNGERFLKEAIDSVYAQSFTDWEIIFCDSGSTDLSVDIALSYGPKIKVFKIDKPVPLGQARQEAVDKACGQFLAFLDVDDCWLPFKLQVQYDLMKTGDYDICYGGVQCIDEDGKSLYKIIPVHLSGPMFEKQLRHVEGSWCTYVVDRHKLLQKGTKFTPTMRSSCEEDMILSFLALNGTGVVAPKILSKYRIVSGSVTSFYSERLASERFSTLHRLISEWPNVRDLYPDAFRAAEARGYYYEARYLMDHGKYREAKEAISKASELNNHFVYLKMLLQWPWLWKFAHRIKGHLAPFWLSLSAN